MDPILRLVIERTTQAVIVACLEAAKQKIASGWCQRHMAMSRVGMVTSPHQNKSAKFCIMGAITAVTPHDYDIRRVMRLALVEALPLARRKLHQISEWNDEAERTQEEVVALFDQAIANVNNWTIAPMSGDERLRVDPEAREQLQTSLQR